MHAALIITLLATADPAPTAPYAAAPLPLPLPAPVARAAPVAVAVPGPALELGSGPGHATGPALPGATLPVLLVAGAAGAALFLARRRTRRSRFVQVLETASLGPRRALVVARLGEQVLLLGSSEAGIHLLSSQAAGPDAHAAADAVAARLEPPPAPEPARFPLLARLRRREATPPPAFDALLAESAEDQELRRKLSRGQIASVP